MNGFVAKCAWPKPSEVILNSLVIRCESQGEAEEKIKDSIFWRDGSKLDVKQRPLDELEKFHKLFEDNVVRVSPLPWAEFSFT